MSELFRACHLTGKRIPSLFANNGGVRKSRSQKFALTVNLNSTFCAETNERCRQTKGIRRVGSYHGTEVAEPEVTISHHTLENPQHLTLMRTFDTCAEKAVSVLARHFPKQTKPHTMTHMPTINPAGSRPAGPEDVHAKLAFLHSSIAMRLANRSGGHDAGAQMRQLANWTPPLRSVDSDTLGRYRQ